MALTPEQIAESETLKRLFLEKAGMTQKEFFRVNGLGTPANLGQYLQGRRALTIESALKIAKGLGVRVEDFSPRLARQISNLKFDQNVQPTKKVMKKVPILGEVECGRPNARDAQNAAKAISEGDYVFVDEEMPDGTFAVRLSGSSMLPIFAKGDIVIIDPTLRPRPGDYVVAERDEGCDCEGTFKKFRVSGYDEFGRECFELVPLNPDFPTLSSTQMPLRIAGVMVEHRRRYR